MKAIKHMYWVIVAAGTIAVFLGGRALFHSAQDGPDNVKNAVRAEINHTK